PQLSPDADDTAADVADPAERAVKHPGGPRRTAPASTRRDDPELAPLEQRHVELLTRLNQVALLFGRRSSHLLEAVLVEHADKARRGAGPDEGVDVTVRACHPAEEEVERPAAPQPAVGRPPQQ